MLSNSQDYSKRFPPPGRGFFKAAKYVSVSCTGVDVPTSVIVMCLSCLGFLVSTLFLIVSVCVEQIADRDMTKTWVHPSILVRNSVTVFIGLSFLNKLTEI